MELQTGRTQSYIINQGVVQVEIAWLHPDFLPTQNFYQISQSSPTATTHPSSISTNCPSHMLIGPPPISTTFFLAKPPTHPPIW